MLGRRSRSRSSSGSRAVRRVVVVVVVVEVFVTLNLSVLSVRSRSRSRSRSLSLSVSWLLVRLADVFRRVDVAPDAVPSSLSDLSRSRALEAEERVRGGGAAMDSRDVAPEREGIRVWEDIIG